MTLKLDGQCSKLFPGIQDDGVHAILMVGRYHKNNPSILALPAEKSCNKRVWRLSPFLRAVPPEQG